MNCDVSKAEAIRNLEKQIATQDRAVRAAEQYVIDGGFHRGEDESPPTRKWTGVGGGHVG